MNNAPSNTFYVTSALWEMQVACMAIISELRFKSVTKKSNKVILETAAKYIVKEASHVVL